MGLQKRLPDSIGEKVAIFSVWGVFDGEPAAGGYGGIFTGEGTGYQILLPFEWIENVTYRLKLNVDSHYLFMNVINTDMNEVTYIGKIDIVKNDYSFTLDTATFTEIYTPLLHIPPHTCDEAPYTRVRVAPTYSGNVKSATTRFGSYGGCKQYEATYSAKDGSGDVFQVTGTSVIPFIPIKWIAPILKLLLLDEPQ